MAQEVYRSLVFAMVKDRSTPNIECFGLGLRSDAKLRKPRDGSSICDKADGSPGRRPPGGALHL